mmetsp:Transcript_43076/g.77488  ORF Transcript_43076/g.77488 Transcript_43076/m.77488 type:complete len:190 (+) Transcript_43076:55-624(+)
MKTTCTKRVVLSLLLVHLGLHLPFTHTGRSTLVALYAPGGGEDAHSHGHHDVDEEGRMLGADVTKLMNAAHEGNMVEVLKLVSQGVNLDATDDFGWTAIRFAARNGHADIVNTLVEQGCDMHKASATGRTPLMSAAGNRHDRVVEVLMSSGADAMAKDNDGLTAYDLTLQGKGGEKMRDLVSVGQTPGA